MGQENEIRQAMYKVTMSHVHVAIVAVEKQPVLNILSVFVFLPYLSDMQRAGAVLGLSGSTIHYLISYMFFCGGGVTEQKMCFLLCLQIFV